METIMRQMQFKIEDHTVAATAGIVGGATYELNTKGFAGVLILEVESDSGSAATLTEFDLEVKSHQDGSWHKYISDTDWGDTTLVNMLFCTTLKPYLVTAGNVSMAMVRLNGPVAIRFSAKVGANTALIHVRGAITTDQG
jgi:hypothetical protein